jgi:hypothetical protein
MVSRGTSHPATGWGGLDDGGAGRAPPADDEAAAADALF